MNKQTKLVWGAGLGAITGLCVIALSYLAQQVAGFPFFPFTLFDWLARVLPGGIVNLGIDSMVRLIVGLGLGPIAAVAKAMEQLLGMLLWLAACAVVGVILAVWMQRYDGDLPWRAGTGRQTGALAGLALALLVVVSMSGLRNFGPSQPWTLLWLAILVPGWGAVLGDLLERLNTLPDPGVARAATPPEALPAMSRRAFLARAAGGSIVAALVATGLGWLLAEDRARTGAAQPLAELKAQAAAPGTPPAGSVPAATAAAAPEVVIPATPAGRTAPAPGSRPEVTPTADFYRIDINLLPPKLAAASWQLHVTGLFDRPRDLSLQDLVAMPAVTQPITQSCISNPIGGDLISSAYYTGVRLADVLQELGLRPEAKELALRSADGFYEAVEHDDLMDPRTLLVYGMNGETLPVEHGYPLRIYIPNRYGMKQPKWITSMEAIDHSGRGYWVDRGWSAEAHPQVISIIDTVAKEQVTDGRVPVGGIAWAGDRGIKSVEVQVDTGEWSPAALITPPIGPLMWVQWRYDWPMTPGRHTFRVRATDGKGALQIGQDHDTAPDGATGYHSVTVAF